MAELKVFAGRNSKDLAHRVCDEIGIELGRARTNLFPDGEVFVKLDDDVRGRDCYVVISTCEPVNDNLMELLVFCDCLRRASAKRVTMVMPYYGYGRQDRKDEGRVPITAKLVANLITAAGANRVLAMDLHAAQIQGFFDIPVDHLNAGPVILEYLHQVKDASSHEIVMVSPDVGNVKMASSFANALGVDIAIIDKRRKNDREVESTNIIGEVKGRDVFMVDDMISTAGTVTKAAALLKDQGAGKIIVACTHAVFVGMALERMAEAPIDQIVVTDTIPAADRFGPIQDKVTVLSVGDLIGEAIHRIHHNRSVSSLLQTGGGKR